MTARAGLAEASAPDLLAGRSLLVLSDRLTPRPGESASLRPPVCGAAPEPGLQTYYINLDASLERRRHMEAELGRCGVPAARVPGIDGAALPPDLKGYFCDPASQVAAPLTRGEIGCHAAHLAVCQRFLADAGPAAASAALVLEDDVALPDDLGPLLTLLFAALPAGWDIVRLSSRPKHACLPVAPLGRFRLVKYSRVPNYTGAYLLSPAGARKLLRPGLRRHPIDNYLRRPWLAGLNTYGVVPPPVSVRAFPSDIDAAQGRSPCRAGLRRWWHRADLPGLPARLAYEVSFLGVRGRMRLLLMNAAGRLLRGPGRYAA